MPEVDAALARRFVDAFNAGLDEFIACHAEDVVHETAPEWPEAGTYHGRDEVRRLWASILGVHAAHEIVLDEVLVIDQDRLLSKLRWRARGASSGVTTTTPIYTVFACRAGLVTRVQYFLDEQQALDAAGLSE